MLSNVWYKESTDEFRDIKGPRRPWKTTVNDKIIISLLRKKAGLITPSRR